jgi:glucan phosphoethanolaminetransferase (alkaline phosphatase superfamily)
MDKQQLMDKTAETLRPFETGNLMTTIQNLTLHQIFTHPAILICIALVFFYGVIKRSKIVLLTLFALLALIVLLRFAMPAPGEVLSLKALLPFMGGGLVIGGVIIYFTFIKSE